jgi:hypothetical protein
MQTRGMQPTTSPHPDGTAEFLRPNSPRFCRDCRHYRRHWLFADMCQRPRGASHDPVTGARRQPQSLPARAEREGYLSTPGSRPVQLFGACGPFAHYWEAKTSEESAQAPGMERAARTSAGPCPEFRSPRAASRGAGGRE